MSPLVMPSVEALRRLPLFAGISPEEFDSLAEQGRVEHFEREATIFLHGDPCERFFVVQSGQVKIVRHDEDGRDVIIEVISPGETFGGASLLLPRQPATAKALEECSIISVSAQTYQAFLQQHPQVIFRIVQVLAGRLHSMMELQLMAGERVERRMAHILLKLARRTGRKEPDGVLIPIPLSRQDLADMAGTTLESAIRTMSRFRSEGLIKSQRGGYVVITDLAALEALTHKT